MKTGLRCGFLLFLALVAFAALAMSACGGSGSSGTTSGVPPTSTANPSPTPTPTTTSSVAHDHVFLVVLENHPFSSVIGNPVMPFLNGLAQGFGLAGNYFANAHPSLPNYFMLTVGQTEATSDDFIGPVTDDNVVRELTAAGKSWRAYAESLPAVGYTGGDQPPYIKHHNPFAYLSDVVSSSAQAGNMVPFSQFSGDLQSNSLASYSYLVPNNQHNAHDCPAGMVTCTDNDKLAAADAWLSGNIGPLINSAGFKQSGLLIITFDESVAADTDSGGGHIATVIVSSKTKPGFVSNTFFQHESTLRLMLRALGVQNFPGAAANAPDMDEFFK